MTVWPAGVARPNTSSLNYRVNDTIPNAMILPLGVNGQISFYNEAGNVDVLVDVSGWFPVGSSFTGVTPARLLDTRVGGTTIDGTLAGVGKLGAGSSLNVSITGRGGIPAAGVGAVALNVTASSPTASSYMTVWPTGASRPNASNLNYSPGQTIPNFVIVPVSGAGQVSLYNETGSLDVLVDVMGWFPVGSSFYGLSPARMLDTRAGGITADGQFTAAGRVGAGLSIDVTLAGRASLPTAGVGAVALNVTATSGTASSYLTVWPTGVTRPNASNVNFAAGQTIPNMVIVPVGANGQVSIYNDSGAVDLLVDVLGWFPTIANAPSLERVSVGNNYQESFLGGVKPAMSADGRYIAFESTYPVLPTAYPGKSQVYLRDKLTGVVKRVSASNTGTEGDSDSSNPAISADGRYVTFASIATNLVNGDTNGVRDIFVRDTVNSTTTRISVASGVQQAWGDSDAPAISADGRFVTYYSFATNLVANDTNGKLDVFLRDTQTLITSRISVSTGGVEGNDDSKFPTISADGKLITYSSLANNLAPGDAGATLDVFVRDTSALTTTLVSVSTTGTKGNGKSQYPSISGDGSTIVFDSDSTNLVAGDTNAFNDVFARNLHTGVTTRVSTDSLGTQGNDNSQNATVSGDGRYVVFESAATNLVNIDINTKLDVFLRDTISGSIGIVSTGALQSNGGSYRPQISPDGRFVVFESYATNLVIGDGNGAKDCFLADNGTT